MLVGGELFAVRTEFRVSVPNRHIAKNLIVGPVLLEDVDDMLDGLPAVNLERQF